MNRSTFITMLVLAALAAGCRNGLPVTNTVIVHDTTTVVNTVTVRDTVLITERASVDVRMQIDQLLKESLKGFEKQFKNAKLHVVRINDTVRITCECDTIALTAQLRDRYQHEWRKTLTARQQTIPVKYIPRWVQVLAWIGGALSAATLIYIIIKIKL